MTQRGKFFYQILSWAMESNYVATRSEIESVIASFRPVEERQPVLQANLQSIDGNCFGWQTVNGLQQCS